LNEYWFFKDDPTRLFVKKQVVPTEMSDVSELKYAWFFIDSEDHFEQLNESLNVKGIRERKLLEGLKKIRTSIKLKKGKRPVISSA